MEKPTIEERLVNEITKIHLAIRGFSINIDSLYKDWKFPVQTPTDEAEPRLREQREENRTEQQMELLRKQNKILIYTVEIAVASVVITALVGVADIILRIFFNK